VCYARLRGAPLTRVQVVPFRDALGQLADIEPRTIRFKRDDTHIYTQVGITACHGLAHPCLSNHLRATRTSHKLRLSDYRTFPRGAVPYLNWHAQSDLTFRMTANDEGR
jgi:hypothetical protein